MRKDMYILLWLLLFVGFVRKNYEKGMRGRRLRNESLAPVVAASVASGDGTLLDQGELMLVHVGVDDSLDTVGAKGDGERQACVKLVAVGREGNDGELVEGDAKGDLRDDGSDTKGGGTLEIDDAVGLVGDLGSLGGTIHLFDLLKGEHGLASDAGGRPNSNLLVTMVTDNVGMDRGLGDFHTILDGDAEANRVEVGAGSDDLVRGETGELLGHASEDIDGVGDEHEDGGLLNGLETIQDTAEDVFVTEDELVTALTGLLAGTGGDDDDVSLTALLGGADANFGRGDKGGILKIEHLTLADLCVEVVDEQL